MEDGTQVRHPPAVQLSGFFFISAKKVVCPSQICRPYSRSMLHSYQSQQKGKVSPAAPNPRGPTLLANTRYKTHSLAPAIPRYQKPSAPCRMRPHCLHLSIPPGRVRQMTQSPNSTNKFNKQWYFHKDISTHGENPEGLVKTPPVHTGKRSWVKPRLCTSLKPK